MPVVENRVLLMSVVEKKNSTINAYGRKYSPVIPVVERRALFMPVAEKKEYSSFM